MVIRRYMPSDCEEMAELFYHTAHIVNAKDYSVEQLNAWAAGNPDLEKWNQSFLAHYSIVAVENNHIVGFGDITGSGYLDRLYVHKDFQRRGIATAICNELEQAGRWSRIVSHVSITARSFFGGRGYKVCREQQVERQGVFLTNYVMEKSFC